MKLRSHCIRRAEVISPELSEGALTTCGCQRTPGGLCSGCSRPAPGSVRGGLRPRLAEAGLGIDDLSHRLDRGALRIGSARSHEQFDEVLVIYDQKPLAVTHADDFITCGDDSGTTGPTESRGIRLREEGCEFRNLFLQVASRIRLQCLAAYVE